MDIPIFSKKIPPNFDVAVENKNQKICKQVIPDTAENFYCLEELSDPIGDEKHSIFPGVIHRYPDRLLLLITRRCAIHCRFCFRKIQVAQQFPDLGLREIQKVCQYLESHPEIKEIILSGGDPLIISSFLLQEILTEFEHIKTVNIVRIHTRMPIAFPQRFDNTLLQVLHKSSKPIWMVIHINSKDEITLNTAGILKKLSYLGIPLLSQTVLLHGINDTFNDLQELFETLLQHRVKPYYLHYPDLVPGTSHFRIPLEKAIDLVKSLRGKISGLAIPDLVVDIPGGYGKIVIAPELSKKIEPNVWEFVSPCTDEKITVRYPKT